MSIVHGNGGRAEPLHQHLRLGIKMLSSSKAQSIGDQRSNGIPQNCNTGEGGPLGPRGHPASMKCLEGWDGGKRRRKKGERDA